MEKELIKKRYVGRDGSDENLPSNISDQKCWWSNSSKEYEINSSHRWSYSSDNSEANVQNRLCCSPADDLESNLSGDNELLIVNKMEEPLCQNYINLSPANSPASQSSDLKCKKENENDDDTADDELVDFSVRYKTDNPVTGVSNKRDFASSSNMCRSNKKIENNRSKPYSFDYAETDLDQPTDYSIRYIEEDTDEAEKENDFYTNDHEDTVRTYYTEGTPLETPYNFSTSTSMSDLRGIDDKDRHYLEISPYKKTVLKDKPNERKSRIDKLTAERLENLKVQNKKVLSNYKVQINKVMEHHDLGDNYRKTIAPPYSPFELSGRCNKDNKSAKSKFNPDDSFCAQETPMMFSRSSSVDSLSEFEQQLTVDDSCSEVSEFSQRNSEVVSPSELPDSPTQLELFNPLHKVKKTKILEKTTLKVNCQILKNNFGIFEDELVTFKEESNPKNISSTNASSLSSLTIDDDLDECDGKEIVDKVISFKEKSKIHNPIEKKKLINLNKQNSNYKSVHLNCSPGKVKKFAQCFENVQSKIISNKINSSFEDGLTSFKEGSIPKKTHEVIEKKLVFLRNSEDAQYDNNEFVKMVALQDKTNSMHMASVYKSSLIPKKQKEYIKPPFAEQDASGISENYSYEKCRQRNESVYDKSLVKKSCFEDNLVSFKIESTPIFHSTSASSLSSLTVDDDCDEIETKDIINNISGLRVKTPVSCHKNCKNSVNYKSDFENQCFREERQRENCSKQLEEDSEEDENIISAYISMTTKNNAYRQIHSNHWQDNKNKISKIPVHTSCNKKSLDTKYDLAVKTEDIIPDVVKTYCTENTPIYISRCGSQSNLSVLSMITNMSNEIENFEETEETIKHQHRSFKVSRQSPQIDLQVSDASSDFSENEDHIPDVKRIDVSPFDSQLNLANFSELNLNSSQKNHEIQTSCNININSSSNSYEMPDSPDEDDIVLEEYIRSGLSKVTRRHK